MMTTWRLEIDTGNTQAMMTIFGAEEIMRRAAEDWSENRVGDGLFVVDGYANSCDRAEVKFWIKREEIRAMTLTKMY